MINPKYTSFFIIINVIYSFFHSFYLLAFLELCVMITSIIHHNGLMPNFRKYDLTVTFSVILYHWYIYAYLITSNYYTWLPCIFYVLGISLYLLSDDYKPTPHSINIFDDKYHGYMHIIGLIANIFLINCLRL
jgi:hypothetical protein